MKMLQNEISITQRSCINNKIIWNIYDNMNIQNSKYKLFANPTKKTLLKIPFDLSSYCSTRKFDTKYQNVVIFRKFCY
jgi:hypothetical protein